MIIQINIHILIVYILCIHIYTYMYVYIYIYIYKTMLDKVGYSCGCVSGACIGSMEKEQSWGHKIQKIVR